MTLAELPQIQALSTREKLELVDEIWKSVSASPDFLEVTQEEKELLDSRWAEFMGDPASALSVDGFKRKLDALRA
jgi:putative addiction module component (TIGR02574 family)